MPIIGRPKLERGLSHPRKLMQKLFRRRGLAVCDFIGYNREALQPGRSERSRDGHIRRIATRGHEHSSDSRLIVARVESPPPALKVDLKPRTEVHRSSDRNSDVAQISGRVSRGNVQATAKGNCEMLKIAADALAVRVDIQRRFRRTRERIAKSDVCMYPIANRLHATPS